MAALSVLWALTPAGVGGEAWASSFEVFNPFESEEAESPSRGSATPEGAVERLHEALIAAMRIPGVDGYRSRVETVEPVVMSLFDFPMIGRLVLGGHWKTLSEADRVRFLEVFGRYVVSNYAAEFDTFNGHAFKTEASAESQPKVVMVRARLVTGSGETHRFDYQTREKGGSWYIVNVAVDGVSDLGLKRSQYDAVIRKDGFEALLSTLEAKIAGFARGEKDDD